MTASISAPLSLDPDSLEFAVFEKIRRNGAQMADGKTILHNGEEYGLTVHAISTITTVHVVIEKLSDPAIGHQRAMAIVDVHNNGYHGGPDGVALLLPALLHGVHVDGHPSTRSYRVLPCIEVPGIFAKSQDEAMG